MGAATFSTSGGGLWMIGPPIAQQAASVRPAIKPVRKSGEFYCKYLTWLTQLEQFRAMRKIILFLSFLIVPTAAFAGLLGSSANDVAKLLRPYKGSAIDPIVAALGYPDRQEPVFDKTAYFWGEDHETGPVCIVKIVAGTDKIVVDLSVYGNIEGCDPVAKELKKANTQRAQVPRD